METISDVEITYKPHTTEVALVSRPSGPAARRRNRPGQCARPTGGSHHRSTIVIQKEQVINVESFSRFNFSAAAEFVQLMHYEVSIDMS